MTGTVPCRRRGGDAPDRSGSAYDAVLLAGFGGPEGPDDVMPFLRNVTRGRGIPEERLVEVSHHYQALGGGSPINEQNRALRAALEAELRAPRLDVAGAVGQPQLGAVSAPTWSSRRTPTVSVRLLGLATSAYSSYSSCRQYREDFGLALHDTTLVGSVRIDKVRPYFDRRGLLAPFVDGTVAALRAAAAAGLRAAELEVVFTTHSIPMTMADTLRVGRPRRPRDRGRLRRPAPGRRARGRSDRSCARDDDETPVAVGDVLAAGLPVPLRPPIGAVAGARHQRRHRRSGGGGPPGVIVVPIGFVSDHVEVDLGSRQRGGRDRCGARTLLRAGRHTRCRFTFRRRARGSWWVNAAAGSPKPGQPGVPSPGWPVRTSAPPAAAGTFAGRNRRPARSIRRGTGRARRRPDRSRGVRDRGRRAAVTRTDLTGRVLRVGTRGSALALAQSSVVARGSTSGPVRPAISSGFGPRAT